MAAHSEDRLEFFVGQFVPLPFNMAVREEVVEFSFKPPCVIAGDDVQELDGCAFLTLKTLNSLLWIATLADLVASEAALRDVDES